MMQYLIVGQVAVRSGRGRAPRGPAERDLGERQDERDGQDEQEGEAAASRGGSRLSTTRRGRYSGSGRSADTWHSVQTHVRKTCLLISSRRSVHGMKASRPQRGQRSGRAPGGSVDGSHGILAGIEPMLARRSRFA